MPDELVLCFPRSLFDEIGAFHGIESNVARYIPRILDRSNTVALPRSQAEKDPSFKQIIPYVLVTKDGRLLHYVRGKGSGEKRLVALGSIGIGGHINYERDRDMFQTGDEFYEEAVKREMNEELLIDGGVQTKVIALLNDDTNEVGQVHLGVVHLCDLGDATVSKGEAAITELRFLTLPELLERRAQMETWSQLCLDFLASCWDELIR